MPLTRRSLLAAAAGIAAGFGAEKENLLPSEAQNYADPATELNVFRLTDPSHQSWLPPAYNRAISHRGNFLLYTSDRSGNVQAYRMDLKTGQSLQLTSEAPVLPGSLALTPDERNILYISDASLQTLSLANLRSRKLCGASAGSEFAENFSVSDDGLHACLVEKSPERMILRLINTRTGNGTKVAEVNEGISDPIPRPRRASILYRRSGDLWLVNFDGAQNRHLRVAEGRTGPALWSTDGRRMLYLSFPLDRTQLNALREFTPDTNDDRLIARTSQFVQFARNADGSVIVGASGTKASPYVLLLVTSVNRELTLCEHKASDPSRVAPVFSPDSQRVFFQSDRHGKQAIYMMNVAKLVAQTDAE